MTTRDNLTSGYTPSEPFLVITAANYNPLSAGRVVVYCHGAGQNLAFDEPSVRADLDILADYGHVVVAPNSTSLTNWANDPSIASIDSMLTYVDNAPAYNANVTSPLFIADSMGAALAINWAVRNPSRLGKASLRVPAVAMQTMHDTNAGGVAAGMEAAYTNLAGLVAAYPTHDPSHATFKADFITKNFASKFRVMYNAADPIVMAADVTGWCTAVGVTAINMGGPSHAPWGYFDIAAQQKWLTS